jgi:arsenate reductase-like glutaredoxin family protein
MKFIKEYWMILLWAITTIGGGVAYYVQSEVKQAKYEERMFKDAHEKVKVVDYVEEAPTPVEIQRTLLLDSINKATAIEFRRRAIQSMEAQEKRAKYQDSILLLNADQMYQIKEELKKRN